jgi:hypothetical protein
MRHPIQQRTLEQHFMMYPENWFSGTFGEARPVFINSLPTQPLYLRPRARPALVTDQARLAQTSASSSF